ncbi:MAG: tetratricopeptide repeat protein [Candidatus Omnitrophica bacterium]|nr:tetratricopeptide repeat protein [Candidatus Omnitrophota bacterium]
MRVILSLFLGVFLIGAGAGCSMLQDAPEAPFRVESASVLYEKAMGYYQKGQYLRAKESFHEFIGQYPESLLFKTALYDLAHCYQILGETKEALALYNRIVTTYGDADFWGEQAMKRIKQIQEEQ